MDITSYLLGKKSSGGGGGDLSNYYNTSPESMDTTLQDTHPWLELSFIKKTPDLIIPDNASSIASLCYGVVWETIPKIIFNENVTSISNLFYNCKNVKTIDTSGFNTSKVINCEYTFSGCNQLTEINTSGLTENKSKKMRNMFTSCLVLSSLDLRNFYSTENNIDTRQMFSSCSNLQLLDMRSFDFTKISSNSGMFNQVPTNCLIVVKDATQKEWFTTNFSTMTNVKTVEEYEAMQ